ncbi:helix-turn-helix domain-containing protein [Rhabdothermincola sediminis]|uniref:helix-turn-helix domain-containing protein n=1 Tax=Rhabdothermincola sediminis TaxID=2751370 RepID=UPI001AA08286|nr:helix-turn-helix transcriptional regulator [Rhabdothermincola sediminis]
MTQLVQTRTGKVLLATPLLLATTFGTSASAGFTEDFRAESLFFVTGGAPQTAPRGLSRELSDEVVELRDLICLRGGLTRQQVARCLGVDRRSLTGWANGTIRPTQERVEALRFLWHLVEEIDNEFPGRTRDVLLGTGSGEPLFNAIADGRLADAANWRSRVAGEPQHSIQVTTRRPTRRSLYEPALAALLAGKLTAPERRPTLRPEDTYEIEPDDARLFEEVDQDVTLRRRGYR